MVLLLETNHLIPQLKRPAVGFARNQRQNPSKASDTSKNELAVIGGGNLKNDATINRGGALKKFTNSSGVVGHRQVSEAQNPNMIFRAQRKGLIMRSAQGPSAGKYKWTRPTVQ